ncbi:MAG: hypothetical protein KatS3mg129_3269 [Leptospiraceae bacterium]|nr:MAG: hypothetical protein KatS3mg129_0690 [Leptospiraceae bacterium]GIX43536.1 MAG: hypothetical protein KatS3mg129_3269 [Leptospiraceae bacterium]
MYKIETIKEKFFHFPVMYREVLYYFSMISKTNPLIIDCTLGSGGHASFNI